MPQQQITRMQRLPLELRAITRNYEPMPNLPPQ